MNGFLNVEMHFLYAFAPGLSFCFVSRNMNRDFSIQMKKKKTILKFDFNRYKIMLIIHTID
jgi:hypothetical protein